MLFRDGVEREGMESFSLELTLTLGRQLPVYFVNNTLEVVIEDGDVVRE
jgi:hypothetical protein